MESSQLVMNINIIAMSLMTLAVGYFVYQSFLNRDKPPPSELPWVPIQVGKNKRFVNQVRDAGMFIEATRRQAIIRNPDAKFSYKDSTNGALEWYGLTSICICPGRIKPICPPAPDVVWSDGDANDEICDIIDSGGAAGMYDIVDFGGAEPNACDT